MPEQDRNGIGTGGTPARRRWLHLLDAASGVKEEMKMITYSSAVCTSTTVLAMSAKAA